MSLLLLLNGSVWGAPGAVCPSLSSVSATALTLSSVTAGTLTLGMVGLGSCYPNHPNCIPGMCIPGDDEGILALGSVTPGSLSLTTVSPTGLSLSVVTPCEG